MMKAGAIVLAGGASRRMGTPKPWLQIDGRTLLERVIDVVAIRCAPVLIVARGQLLPAHPRARRLDESLHERGPLGGLAVGLACLHAEGIETVYVSSADAALVSLAHLDFMQHTLDSDRTLAAVAPAHDGHVEPLAAALRTTPALRACEELLERGERRLAALFEVLPARLIPTQELPDAAAVLPCNTAEDLAGVERALRQRRKG
jgi:molybdenum cofactor guanylyltransferase